MSKTPARNAGCQLFWRCEGKYLVRSSRIRLCQSYQSALQQQWQALLSAYFSRKEFFAWLDLAYRQPKGDPTRRIGMDAALVAGGAFRLLVLLSKADKLNRQQQILVLRETQQKLSTFGQGDEALLFLLVIGRVSSNSAKKSPNGSSFKEPFFRCFQALCERSLKKLMQGNVR